MNAVPAITAGPLITYSTFPDTKARQVDEAPDVDWSTFVEGIVRAREYPAKSSCPLISLCEYGDAASTAGSLRHAANVTRVFGIEVDYDGGEISLPIAAARLRAARLRAVLHTSASHTPDAPRWRALLPLSEPALPADRALLVGRVNRALGGIVSRESFTLSQSFYIGRVKGTVYETEVVDGRCVDEAHDLDPLPFALEQRPQTRALGTITPTRIDSTTDAELRTSFERGQDRYQAMLKLSARWAARGMAEDDVAAALDALFADSDTMNADGIDLRQRIPGIARSAVAKYGETRTPRSGDDTPPPADPPPWLDLDAVDLPSIDETNTTPPAPLFITGAQLMAGIYSPPTPIVEGLLMPGATLMHGPAKKGKSWLLLQLATAIDSGVPFCGFRTSRRDVAYVGAEDDEARFRSRLQRIGERGSVSYVTRQAVERFANTIRDELQGQPIAVDYVVRRLWQEVGRPSVLILDTQEVFEHALGISHGKAGDSVTRRDYLATSSYDGVALKLGISIVLVGHWGEIKSIEKATLNPHESINTTKARLAGVTTSITLGPLPNQEPGVANRDMQLSIRSRDIPGGDRFLWVRQDDDSGRYDLVGEVRDVLVTEAQASLFAVLIAARKQHGVEHWTSAAELADELDVTVQAVKQMVGRVRRAAKAKGRAPTYSGFTLESKPNKGYRAA